MKNACMGRLGGLLGGKEKGCFTLSSWKVVVQDLLLLKKRKTTDTGTLRASKPSSMTLNFINNRSRIKTLQDDDNNNGFPCAPCQQTLGNDNHDNNGSWTTTFQDDGNNNSSVRRGFTLIELLVVVLIIGILASYAVPSYRVAVGTSRAATMYALMHTIDEAQELYLMRTNHYSANLNSLVIAMPAGFRKVSPDIISSNDMRCGIVSFNENTNSSIRCWDLKNNVSLEKYHKQTYYICWAPQTNDLANRICQNLSGLDTYSHTGYDGTSSFAYYIR